MTDPVQKSFVVEWADLADPWRGPCGIARGLHALRWLAETADDPAYVRHERWGSITPFQLLSCSSAYKHYVEPIRSEEDLRRRLQFAVVAGHRSEIFERWRADHGIVPGRKQRITGLHGGAPRSFHELMQQRYDPEDRSLDRRRPAQLAVSLNSIHLRAVDFCGVELRLCRPFPSKRGARPTWSAVLRFGLDGSRWDHELTEEREGESLDVFGHRALRLLEALLGTPPGWWGRPRIERGSLPIVDTDWAERSHPCSVFRDIGYRRHEGLNGNLERTDGPFPTRAEAEDVALRRLDEIEARLRRCA